MSTTTDTQRVSRNCANGHHKRCLGTVYVSPPEKGKRLAPCECPVSGCGHGSDVTKARRSR